MSGGRNIFEEIGSDSRVQAAVTGGLAQGHGSVQGGVIRWLWGLILLIVVMILVGGLTRLTDSGLSITEWDPVMGAIPPLSAAAWDAAFAAYKSTAEYQTQNMGMTIADFQFIFWWEWGHRQLGRFIGLYWAVGFIVFWAMGRLLAARRMAIFWIGPFIGVQGVIGWLMVASGLDGVRIDVASYWLMAHLGMAFALLGYVYWQLCILSRSAVDIMQARRNREARLWGMSTGLMHLAMLQILLGALVAGIDAGRNYIDWPLMAGGFFPPDMFDIKPAWRNFFENDGLVQFIHRISAYLLLAYGIMIGAKAKQSPHSITRRAFGTVGLLLIAQVAMGIVTVMHSSPWYMAIIHQFLAIALWLAVLRARFMAGYPQATSVRG